MAAEPETLSAPTSRGCDSERAQLDALGDARPEPSYLQGMEELLSPRWGYSGWSTSAYYEDQSTSTLHRDIPRVFAPDIQVSHVDPNLYFAQPGRTYAEVAGLSHGCRPVSYALAPSQTSPLYPQSPVYLAPARSDIPKFDSSIVSTYHSFPSHVKTTPATKVTDTGMAASKAKKTYEDAPAIQGKPPNFREAIPYPRYQKRPRPEKFFVPGKVFEILWCEPAGEPGSATSTNVTTDGSSVFFKFRRFIVIRHGHTSCTAIPISTYGGKGTGKRGIVKSEHAIVYTGRLPPRPLPSEVPSHGELPMREKAIRIIPDVRASSLDPLSRLNYGKVFTIEHNLKVASFGVVLDVESINQEFFRVWHGHSAIARSKTKRSDSSPVLDHGIEIQPHDDSHQIRHCNDETSTTYPSELIVRRYAAATRVKADIGVALNRASEDLLRAGHTRQQAKSVLHGTTERLLELQTKRLESIDNSDEDDNGWENVESY